MEPFSSDVLTILTLISIIWTGLTLLTVVIFFLIFLCKFCVKRRQPKMIKPIRTPSIVSMDHPTPIITPVPIKSYDQHKQTTHHYDAQSVLDELPYSSQKNHYQQRDYIHDENDETIAKNENRMFVQRQSRRQYQSVKPMADLRITDRHTPYPADVLARERLMNNTRFPMENKY